MSLLRFATFLCLLTVVFAETKTNASLKEKVCGGCKSAEDVMADVVTMAVQRSSKSFSWMKKRCESFSEDFKKPCADFVFQWKERYDASSKQVAEAAPCETILQCKPEMSYENYLVDNANFCEPCKQLVTALYSKLSIETLVGEGKDVMIEICAMLQISSADCQKAVDEAVERLEVPTPEEACQLAGVCPAWAVAT